VSRTALPRRPLIWLNVWILTVLPVVAIGGTIFYGMTVGITWREILAAMVSWLLTGLAVTAGYHRLFAHRGYKSPAVVRFFYATLGAAACENSAIAWCSDHRYHHGETDTDGDPYDATRGFWYSHIGWIFFEGTRDNSYSNVPDLRADRILAWQHRNYIAVATITNLALAGLAGLLLGRFLGMFLIVCLLRIVVVQHMTFLINSAAHMWGSQPWSKATTSRDNWVLSLFTFGEGYHNYHHSFQSDYRNGPRWWNCDPTKWLIWCLGRVGLASSLRRTPVDVVLATRFKQSCRSFAGSIEAVEEDEVGEWSGLLAEKKKQILARRDQLMESLRGSRVALSEQLIAAEERVQLRIEEIKTLRVELRERMKSAAAETSDELRRIIKREIKHLRRAMREAHRTAKETLVGWERLVHEYSLCAAT